MKETAVSLIQEVFPENIRNFLRLKLNETKNAVNFLKFFAMIILLTVC